MIIRLIKRILWDFAILVCLVQGWWYAAIIIAMICAWNHKLYLEIIIAGLIYDSLYGPVAVNSISSYIGLTLGIALFIMISIMKRVIRMRE